MSDNSGYIIIISQSEEQALEKASNFFKKPKEELSYEIIEKNEKVKIKIFYDRKKYQNNQLNDFSNSNGYFKIIYQNGFASLIVFPPKGNGKPAQPVEISDRMKILNIPKIDLDKIKIITDNALGIPEKLTIWAKGEEYRSKIEISVSNDKMSAYLTLRKAKDDNNIPSFREVMDEIESFQIKYGVNKNEILRMIENKIFDKEILFAEGKKPIKEDGIGVKYSFDTDPGKPFLLDEYDRMNLKELNFIQNKSKNDIIAEYIPPAPGVNGINIFGETILYETGKDITLKAGRNTEFNEDGTKIIAASDGNVVLKNNTVYIEPFVVVENVNYETGNIDFDGSVLVKGTIADGFSVKAGGTLQIGKSVGNVNIEAKNDLILKAGMNGNLEGKIKCKGNIYARFLEGTTVFVSGNLFVEEAVMNCNLKIGKNLVLVGRRAEIIGGEAIIGRSVRCKKIGNSSGVATKILVGIDPEKIEIIEKLKVKIDETRQKLLEITENKEKLEKIRKSGFSDIQKIENAIYNYQSLEIRLKDESMIMEKDYKDAKKMIEPDKDSIILAENLIYQGAQIFFGNEEYKILNKEKNKIILKIFNDKIKEYGYSFKEMPVFKLD